VAGALNAYRLVSQERLCCMELVMYHMKVIDPLKHSGCFV
jgi:hypothetical protein